MRPESELKKDGRVSRAERLRLERRSMVLAAARDLFASKGYHATSIQDILAAADIARGTFYLYFESKRAIFDELLDRFFATLSATVRRIDTSTGAPAPLEQMLGTVDRIFDLLANERGMAKILIREAVGLDVEFDRKLGEFYGRVTDLIARALREGIAMGLVRDCDPELVAWCILGSVKEVIDRTFVASGVATPSGARPDLRATGRGLIQFVLEGVFR